VGAASFSWRAIVIAVEYLLEPVAVSRWLYWSLVIITVLVTGRAVYIATRRFWKVASDPSFFDYLQDSFFGVTWRWRYSPNGRISEESPYCPSCDRALIADGRGDGFGNFQTKMVCQQCGVVSVRDCSPNELKDAVHREIDLKVRNGSFKATLLKKNEIKSRLSTTT